MFEPIASDSSNSANEDQSQDKEGFIIQTGLDVNGGTIDGYIARLDVENYCIRREHAYNVHSCQLSRNLQDSPEFLTCVPEGSRKSALARIVPE